MPGVSNQMLLASMISPDSWYDMKGRTLKIATGTAMILLMRKLLQDPSICNSIIPQVSELLAATVEIISRHLYQQLQGILSYRK